LNAGDTLKNSGSFSYKVTAEVSYVDNNGSIVVLPADPNPSNKVFP
jgi:flagellar basal body L-ring protein FlgH